MSEICNYCEVDFDYHDHSHLACECLPKQIQLLEANLARCREKYENLKEGFRKLNTDSMAYVDRTTDQLSAYKEALEQVDKYWYDPSVATGACIFCDANLFPPDMGKHNDWCVVLVAHKALTPVQSTDAREKETK